MRRVLASAALSLAPLIAAGTDWNFRVTLDGDEIGRHHFSVERDGEDVRVASDAQFAVRVLFFDAYRYTHRARERWRGNCLVALDATTTTNGEVREVRAAVRDARLVIERGEGSEAHGDCQMSFAYWNPAILSARRLLNAQTGELMPVSVRTLGEQVVSVRGRSVTAQRHRIEGADLAIDLWYSQGAWVALESRLAGGRRLRYELA